VTPLAETVERLLAQLPDPRAPQLLFDRLIAENKSLERTFQRDPPLLSDILTLAAWSPLLATTLENNPDYINWLQRERLVTRVRTRDELSESLGRFALINSQLNPHVMLARFRRRELLRTYLHDIRRTRTVVETTDELSSLADVVLAFALNLCGQELDNSYGTPQTIDAQGRIIAAEFCVVALGKLGSGELNYSSDIDLIFMFSADGSTATGGARGQITNREYFVKLAERLLRMVGDQSGEGASYRIDARLRPHGREGALANSLDEAVNYYKKTAEDWELQALIRARAAAGANRLFSRFVERVETRVFRPNVSVAQALGNVREAKRKIDIQHERPAKGFNVKLGRGGIREIEFIAQALQIAFGGDDPWLRTPHTLVTLGRLRERDLISEREYSQLSAAYHFLRALEHRLQMEHGLQTHSVPAEASKRELVARRMNFSGPEALSEFDAALTSHLEDVQAAFTRVFAEIAPQDLPSPRSAVIDDTTQDRISEAATLAANIFSRAATSDRPADESAARLSAMLESKLKAATNRVRALSFLMRIAAAFEKGNSRTPADEAQLAMLVAVCDASEVFGELIASRPELIQALPRTGQCLVERDYAAELNTAVAKQANFADGLGAMRLKWSELLIEIGAHDAAASKSSIPVNRLLTELAAATINTALTVARGEFERRYGRVAEPLRVAILGLGRFGSGGMDYGSDLDIIAVYDAAAKSPFGRLSIDESYARLIEYFINALSSITREGALYRVDLRLRPDGQKGPLVISTTAFLTYVEKRASVWEWLAYVKLRGAAGELEFARKIETSARARIHELARQIDPRQLVTETRRVRDRLQKAKAPRRHATLNIKHGVGGMLDVYFAVRYLQLRDNVPDDGEDRTTRRMLERLREYGSIDEENFHRMFKGYQLLRAVDHQLRLTVGRSATVPAVDAPAFVDIARRLDYAGAPELWDDLVAKMKNIREAYDSIVVIN
jgi:glutamate-ammonia-ligase adenylyltransferase